MLSMPIVLAARRSDLTVKGLAQVLRRLSKPGPARGFQRSDTDPGEPNWASISSIVGSVPLN